MRQTAMDEQLFSICHAEFGLRRATGRHSEVRHLEQMRADTCTLASTNTRTHIHATAVREISKQNVANTHTQRHIGAWTWTRTQTHEHAAMRAHAHRRKYHDSFVRRLLRIDSSAPEKTLSFQA